MAIQENGCHNNHYRKTVPRTRENRGPVKRIIEHITPGIVAYRSLSKILYSNGHKIREETGRSTLRHIIFEGSPAVRLTPIRLKPRMLKK